MKTLRFFSILCLTGFVNIALAQRPEEAQMNIAREGTPEQKAFLLQEIRSKSKKYTSEDDYIKGRTLLNVMGQNEIGDSIASAAAKKFPKGKLARDHYIAEVYYKAEGTVEKEKQYKNILKRWPVDKFPGDAVTYDYMAANLAQAFAEEGNKNKALTYLKDMRERFWRGNGYIPVGRTLLAAGDKETAASLFKTAMDDAYYYLTLPEEQKDNKTRFAAQGYRTAVSMYVDILIEDGRYEEALSLIEDAMEAAPDQGDAMALVYYKSLLGVGRNLEAFRALSKLYSKGQFQYEKELAELYTSLNGSDKGFSSYKEELTHELIKSIRAYIQQHEKDVDAPDFELENLQGETVSLSSLKGKVVVLDFWATWCQPCIRSFPGMKAAQEMYANDPEVQFIFINTWERTKNYKENVKAFIKNNEYPFEVLFDQKNPQTDKNLAEQLGIAGIPAKFIIDKEGKIRYALTGSKPDVEYIKMEMKELIDSAKNERPK